MPIYEFKCCHCGTIFERITRSKEDVSFCSNCGSKKIKPMLSIFKPKSFDAQMIKDIQHEPVYVRNRSELRDSINRFNDTELASVQGKVAIYED